MNRHTLPLVVVMLSACPAAGPVVPAADHHQHHFSPVMVALLDTTNSLRRST